MLNSISKPKKKHKRALPIETLNEVLLLLSSISIIIVIKLRRTVSKYQ